MEYNKQEDGSYRALDRKNVDTGMGLERMAMILQGQETVFSIDLFEPLLRMIEQHAQKPAASPYERSFRIIADHMRAAVFVIGDAHGVLPSNVGQGYVVRRLLRRAIREGKKIGIMQPFLADLAQCVVHMYEETCPDLWMNQERIVQACVHEEQKFAKTLEKGIRELEKEATRGTMTGEQAFILFSTYGFPLELTEEILRERGMQIDRPSFEMEFQKHQERSRSASAGVFKGGLADHSMETTRLHTATHLLHQALRTVLGEHVEQRGSNITAERLRFDFSHPQKMTKDELMRTETLVNEIIARDLTVRMEEMTVEEAKTRQVIGLFGDTYTAVGGRIRVYFIGDFSKEICGGPHVAHTSVLGRFHIQKEEAVSAGVRRIKANLSVDDLSAKT